MEKSIKRVLVILNKKKDYADKILNDVKSFFNKKNIEYLFFSFDKGITKDELENIDLAVSFGGDGTLLYSARIVAELNIPILAVNLGNFGFITEISRNEWKNTFELFSAKKLGISSRIMIQTNVIRNGKSICKYSGLNDAIIETNGVSRLIQLRLYLSDSFAARYRADGLIISTSTGSTAYSMGAGGPIIHPDMDAFILNPICPFTLSNRSLVVPGTEKIEIEVEKTKRAEVVLIVDGRDTFSLKAGDRILFSKYKYKCKIIRSDKRNFYEVLRTKLNWAGEPNA